MLMRPACQTAIVATVLAAWFSATGLPGCSHTDLSGDLAEYVNDPVRVLHGEMPYRDFWLLHPPGEVFLPAAIYRLGFGVNAVLLVNVGISVLVGLAAFWVGRTISSSDVEGVLSAVLVFFAGVPADYVGYVYLHAYLLFLLVAAGLLYWYLLDHRRTHLFFAGMAVGFALVFRIYLSGAAAAALLVIVVLEVRWRRCQWREATRLLAVFGSGAVLVVAAVSACLSDLVPDMWYAVAVDSVAHATARWPAYGHVIVEAWVEFTSALDVLRQRPFKPAACMDVALQAGDFVKTAVTHALPLLGGIFFWSTCRRKGAGVSGATGWMLRFFLLWGLLTFVRGFSSGGRTAQLSQAVTPLYFVLVLGLRPLLARWRATKNHGAGLVACAALATTVGIGQTAAMRVVERWLTWRQESYAVAAPYGTVVVKDKGRAAEWNALVAAVVENSDEEDGIFVIPWNAPAIYALTRRRNPSYYDSTIDLFYRPSEEKQRSVCAALLAKETRLVIGKPDLEEAAWGAAGLRTKLSLVDACIEEHFVRIIDVGRFSVYGRRDVKTGSAAGSADGPVP